MNTKNTIKKIAAVTIAALALGFAPSAQADEPVTQEELAITDMTAQQRYPWNGKVDIAYTVKGAASGGETLTVTASNTVDGTVYTATSAALIGTPDLTPGTHALVWDLDAQGLQFKSENVKFTIAAGNGLTVKAGARPGNWRADKNLSLGEINQTASVIKNRMASWNESDNYGKYVLNGNTDYVIKIQWPEKYYTYLGFGAIIYKESPAKDDKSICVDTGWVTVNDGEIQKAPKNYDDTEVTVSMAESSVDGAYGTTIGIKTGSVHDKYYLVMNARSSLSGKNLTEHLAIISNALSRIEISCGSSSSTSASASTEAAIDTLSSSREAAASETIRFSPAWETEKAGATAVVTIDGVEASKSAETGAYVWTPKPKIGGQVEMTHQVFIGGVQAGTTLTASFTVPELVAYNVAIAESNHGTVTADRTELILEGDKVTLTVTPAAGYALDTLSVTTANGEAVTLDDGKAFTMPAGDVTVSATFRFVPVVTEVVPGIFLVQPQNGTVAIAGTGEAHSLVTLTPTPDEGYALGSLTVTTAGGKALELYEGNTFYMPEESVTVTATFADTRFENKVRLEPNSTYLYTLTVPENVWNAANGEFLQTLARVYTGEGCALALSSELSGEGTLTTTPADGFSAKSAMVAADGVMKTTITIKTGAVASYAAFSAVSQGTEYGEADSAKRTAAQAALKSATLAKATVTQEASASGGGDLLSGFSTSLVNGKYHAQNGYTLVDGNPRDYGWKIFYNDNNTDATFPGTYDLEPNSEYTLTLAVPKDAWNLDMGQYLQVEVRVYTAVPDGKSLPPIMLASRSASEKAATDPKVKGDVKEYYVKEDGTEGYKYPNGNGYNTGTGVGGYEAEAWMTVRDDGMVETKVVMKTGADGGHLAINLFAYGSGWMNDRLAVGEKAAKEMTLVKTPTETVTEVATEVESSFACGEGGKTVTTTYLTDFNVGTGRWSDTAAALADDGNSYSTDGLKALDSEVEYAQPHTITIAETENGTVTADGTGAVDARITLTVTPAENYKLDTLTVTTANGAAITLDDGNAFIMPDDDVTVSATFLVKAYAIACAAVADGAISVPETADAGSTVTLKFNTLDFVLTANTLAVTAGGENVALTKVDADTYTFTMPDGAVQVAAAYTAIVTQPVLQTESGEEQLTIPAEWRETYKLRNSQVTNVTQKLDNGMTAWQSYVLGRDPTNVLSGIYADVEQDDKTDTVTIEAVGLDENTIVQGFGLTYRLEKTEEPGFLKENAVSPEFDVGIADETQDPTGHYKLSMVVTKDGTPVDGAVEAINTVGIVRQTQAVTNAIISVPWSRLAPGQDAEIQVSEVVKTANLDEGDELRVYRPGSSTYESYTLDAGKQWVAAKTFKVAAVGSGSQSDAPEAPAATITRGSGIWLCRKDPSKPYFLYGQSNGADDSKVEVTKGPNLIGATGTGDYRFDEHVFGAESNDSIMVPGTGDAPLRFEFRDGQWGHLKSEATTIVFKGKEYTTFRNVWSTDDAKVPAGTGFWLFNNSGNVTVK